MNTIAARSYTEPFKKTSDEIRQNLRERERERKGEDVSSYLLHFSTNFIKKIYVCRNKGVKIMTLRVFLCIHPTTQNNSNKTNIQPLSNHCADTYICIYGHTPMRNMHRFCLDCFQIKYKYTKKT